MNRISEEVREKIRYLYQQGYTYEEIRTETGVSTVTIGKIIRACPELDQVHVGGKLTKKIDHLEPKEPKEDEIEIMPTCCIVEGRLISLVGCGTDFHYVVDILNSLVEVRTKDGNIQISVDKIDDFIRELGSIYSKSCMFEKTTEAW